MSDSLTRLNPAQSALLVLDYQPAALSGLSEPDTLVSRTSEAINTARRCGAHVGFVCLGLNDMDYRGVPATNRAFTAVAKGRSVTAGAPETALHPDIIAQPHDIQLRKTRVGAFSTTDLDERLTNLGVTTLILAGVRTSGVVLSTVREAADKDYNLVVLSDCTADPDPEVENVLLRRVFPRQADVVTAADLGEILSGTPTST